MKFNSKNGQEVRTWILFFVGIALALIFAIKGNPLGPWWTIVIGAFTCTAIIVSAVLALAGGTKDAIKQALEEASRDNAHRGTDKSDPPTLSIDLGFGCAGVIPRLRRRHNFAVH